jgi:hypothetical protein
VVAGDLNAALLEYEEALSVPLERLIVKVPRVEPERDERVDHERGQVAVLAEGKGVQRAHCLRGRVECQLGCHLPCWQVQVQRVAAYGKVIQIKPEKVLCIEHWQCHESIHYSVVYPCEIVCDLPKMWLVPIDQHRVNCIHVVIVNLEQQIEAHTVAQSDDCRGRHEELPVNRCSISGQRPNGEELCEQGLVEVEDLEVVQASRLLALVPPEVLTLVETETKSEQAISCGSLVDSTSGV